MAEVRPGTCPKCGSHGVLLRSLHGERGGPVWCLKCVIDWNAEHNRRRKAGRIAMKAMQLFIRAGGTSDMLTRLKDITLWPEMAPLIGPGWEPDTIGFEVGDITSELLADAVQLTHPDRHPPERRELAQRVTQELLALKPFVFPAPKPEPVKPRNSSASPHTDYAMARLKADFLNGYRKKPYDWRSWGPGKTEDQLRECLKPGGREHKYIVEGGAWWQHCQEDIAKFKNVTTNRARPCAGSNKRHAA